MTKFYKLSLLREVAECGLSGANWEQIYIKEEGDKLEIIGHNIPQHRAPLNSKLEEISEEKMKEAVKDLFIIDYGH